MLRRGLSALGRRRFGSHAPHHHVPDPLLSPAAAEYQATHPVLFGEHVTPGVPRVRESWELWTWVLVGGTALLVFAGTYRPNTNPHDWARDEAEERLRRKEAGLDVLPGVHYAGIRYMRETGVVSTEEADALEGGLVPPVPPPAQLRGEQHHAAHGAAALAQARSPLLR